MRDFQNVSRHLIGGFIVFEDSADSSDWGSRLTAQETVKHPDYELIAKNPNYWVRKKRSAAMRRAARIIGQLPDSTQMLWTRKAPAQSL